MEAERQGLDDLVDAEDGRVLVHRLENDLKRKTMPPGDNTRPPPDPLQKASPVYKVLSPWPLFAQLMNCSLSCWVVGCQGECATGAVRQWLVTRSLIAPWEDEEYALGRQVNDWERGTRATEGTGPPGRGLTWETDHVAVLGVVRDPEVVEVDLVLHQLLAADHAALVDLGLLGDRGVALPVHLPFPTAVLVPESGHSHSNPLPHLLSSTLLKTSTGT